jgi:Cysteine-rich secretory protein family
MRRLLARVAVAGLLTSTAGTAAVLAAPTAAFAASNATMESQFISDMNSARQANGLRPYAVASDLTSVARSHSEQMASRQSLYHNPSLTTQVSNWQAVGENVGEGPTVADIHQAFMNSPEHRANILDHDFTQVGVGVTVDGNGIVWVTEDFRQPMSSSSTRSTTTTTHRTTTATTHTTSTRPTATRPAAAPSARSVAPRSHSFVWRPRSLMSARALLLLRLSRMRAAHPVVHPVDPVAGAFDYVSTLSALAR